MDIYIAENIEQKKREKKKGYKGRRKKGGYKMRECRQRERSKKEIEGK